MLKSKRTALVALAIIVVGALQGFDFVTITDTAQQAGYATMALGAIMFILRAITDSAIFSE